MEIFYYSKFEKQFKKLSEDIKLLVIEKEDIFNYTNQGKDVKFYAIGTHDIYE